jgi:hypothetical protein
LSAPFRPRSWAGTLALLLLAAAIPVCQVRVDRRLGGFRAQEEVLYLWSGSQVKRLAAGFEGLAADLYWLRTVQYFGGQRVFSEDRRFELLEPLIDITVTLDPRMEIAYRYGAIFLAEPAPIGAGRPRHAVALLERGVRENPLNWRLHKELGYFHFLFLNEHEEGARILTEASKIPGAAYWLKTLAADLLTQGGDRALSRRIWQQMYDESEEGAIKQNARTHLNLLDTAEMLATLQARVDEFKGHAGRPPHELSELVAAGFIRAVPLDPAGTPFEYDPKKGTVAVSQKSVLWRPKL